MFCPKCGAKIEDDYKYCGNCGAEITVPREDMAREHSNVGNSVQSLHSTSHIAPQIYRSAPKKKKHFRGVIIGAIVLVVVIFSLIIHGDSETENQSLTEKTSQEIKETRAGETNTSQEVKRTETKEKNKSQTQNVKKPENEKIDKSKLKEIDLFDAIDIEYEGWAGLASIKSIKAADDSLDVVRKLVSFEPKSKYENLKNGDIITVRAVFDEAELRREGYYAAAVEEQLTVDDVNTIEEGYSFYNGIAWVKKSNREGVRWVAVDTQGEILFELAEGEIPITHFEDGICIVDLEKIIDQTGKVVWSIENEGWSYAASRWGKDNVNDVSFAFTGQTEFSVFNDELIQPAINKDFFGKVEVRFSIDSWEYSGNATGFLNPDGSWYLEPGSLRGDLLVYEEDGVYRIGDTNGAGSEGYYNILTNEIIWYDELGVDDILAQYNQWLWSREFELHDGLVFYDFDRGKGFLNAQQELAIDLSEYYFEEDPVFKDGYCILVMKKEGESEYYTVLDKSGKRMFEPRKLQNAFLKISKTTSEGLFWVCVDTENIEWDTNEIIEYFNVDGTPAFDSPLKIVNEATLFQEGMAFVKADDGLYYYIGKDGKPVF